MRFIMAVSSMSPAVPAPPAKFPPFSQLSGDWKKEKKKKKLPASSALNHNNYPKKCTAEPVRGEGNEAQRLLAITSLQSLLVIALLLWKRTWTVWEEAMCSQQTDRQTGRQRKGLMWLGAQKVSAISEGFGSTTAPLGTGSRPHTSISLMFCLSGLLLSTRF